jgi:YHS domain-containing protein
MDVAETAEDTVHYQGKVYGFCSAHCKEKFQKNPEKYAAK